jgi:hypothetical protein
MFGALVSERRMASEPSAARTLTELCGHLPLAVWLAGARIAIHIGWTIQHAVDRLQRPASPLEWLSVGDASLRQRLFAAYSELDSLPRQAFRRLGLARENEINLGRMAALLEISIPQAERTLETLVDRGLLQISPETGRYHVPKLFDVFAHELLEAAPEPPRSDD